MPARLVGYLDARGPVPAPEARLSREVDLAAVERIRLDGLNVLTTVEAALAGGVVLCARDGCYRDMASFHGNYRVVEEAAAAAARVGELLAGRPAVWFLDRPVSNTGRLSKLLMELAAERGWPWTVELVPDPDRVLREGDSVVATADSGILDACMQWVNLARAVVERSVPGAWVVDLSDEKIEHGKAPEGQSPSRSRER